MSCRQAFLRVKASIHLGMAGETPKRTPHEATITHSFYIKSSLLGSAFVACPMRLRGYQLSTNSGESSEYGNAESPKRSEDERVWSQWMNVSMEFYCTAFSKSIWLRPEGSNSHRMVEQIYATRPDAPSVSVPRAEHRNSVRKLCRPRTVHPFHQVNTV